MIDPDREPAAKSGGYHGSDALMPHHAAMLEASAIAPEIARERGYRSVTTKAELAALEFPPSQQRVPGLLIPIHNTAGGVAMYLLRPDKPRSNKQGKAIKYETPAGSRMVLDVPPRARGQLGNPAVPLFLTEGSKKADAAASLGLCCVALIGVWNWRGTNVDGGKVALADFEDVALNGRVVYVVFDSDVMTKPEVHTALVRLSAFLKARDAAVNLVYLPAGEGGAKVGLDDFIAAGHGVDDILALASKELRAGPNAQGAEGKPTQASRLVQLAEAAELFRTPDGEPHATIPVQDHLETHRINSSSFKRWLARLLYEVTGEVPSASTKADVIAILEGMALFGDIEAEVHVRLALYDGRFYLDLGDAGWRAVEVGADGWRVVERPPVRFRRPASGYLALPEPRPGGSVSGLRQFLNVTDEDWPLILAWIVAALRPCGPYPVLVLGGEQGSGKSIVSEVLRRLVDPNTAPTRAEPREGRDLMISANNGWVIALDNLSRVSPWLSDALCRLSTGGGFAVRTLYQNDEETIFEAQRPIILNGITELATRSDLLDRAILLNLPRIEDDARKTERVFWRDFDREAPLILGALLDAVSQAIQALPAVHLETKPRMADFAEWAVAAEPGLGLPGESFMAAYLANRGDAHALALEGSSLAAALVTFIEDQDTDWTGTVGMLLGLLEAQLGDTKPPFGWPKDATRLGGELKRLAPNLRAAKGIDVQLLPRTSKGRVVAIHRLSRSSATSSTSVTQQAEGGDAGARNSDAGRSLRAVSVTDRPEGSDAGDAGDAGAPAPVFNGHPWELVDPPPPETWPCHCGRWSVQDVCANCGQARPMLAEALPSSGRI